MSEETIFSKIIRKEISAEIVFESGAVIAFKDINPQAPTHILIVPKKSLRDLTSVSRADTELLGEMLLAAGEIARSQGLEREGFRLVINNGKRAGQEVLHLHMHLLGGRDFTWPPG